MKFKVDENLPAEVRDDLRDIGHDTDLVSDEGLTGAPDEVLLEHVRREKRILLTLDKGIADVRSYPPSHYHGVVVFRPAASGRGTVLSFVRRHLPALLQLEVDGRLLVVTDRSVRIR